MVFVWSSGWSPRRRRRGYGPGRRGFGRAPGYVYGPDYGYGRDYGYRRGYGGGGGSCLRDLLFLNAGCCLAESLGCGGDAFLLAPSTLRSVRSAGTAGHGRMADRLIAAVGVYQREISPKHPPCCRFEPTCSAYAVQALQAHGARRGAWLTGRRLLRCRPGATGGADPVPAAA
jgi:putative membrane protein insertion efficiency factor